MNKTFEELVKDVLNERFSHNWGNEVLYGICVDEHDHPWGEVKYLADKFWLIGRSYAASPERRYIFNEEGRKKRQENPKSMKLKLVGDGTGDFFYYMAEKMLKLDKYNDVAETVKKLPALEFDGSESDIEILREMVACVISFNALTIQSIKKVDEEYNKDVYDYMKHRNHFSFCSKFLHFHSPQTFFILDNYTENGGKLLTLANKKPCELLDTPIDHALREQLHKSYLEIDKRYGDFETQYNNLHIEEKDQNKKNQNEADKASDEATKYRDHCIREYVICCYLKNKDIVSQNLPRVADSVCQRVKEMEEK